LEDIAYNLKKQNCKIPEDPKPSCELDCQKAKFQVDREKEIIVTFTKRLGDCANTENNDAECQDKKNELESQKKLLIYIEAKSKNCTCDTDEIEEIETCEDL